MQDFKRETDISLCRTAVYVGESGMQSTGRRHDRDRIQATLKESRTPEALEGQELGKRGDGVFEERVSQNCTSHGGIHTHTYTHTHSFSLPLHFLNVPTVRFKEF
jgi:hypothetical protein